MGYEGEGSTESISREQRGVVGTTTTQTLMVGTTPVQVPLFICRSVYFKSAGNNTDYVYIGTGPGTGASTGAQVAPNGGVGWGTDRTDRFWIAAASGTQTVYVIISSASESVQYSGGNVPSGSSDTNVNIAQIGGAAVTQQSLGNQIALISSFQQAATVSAAALASHACNVALVKNDDASTIALYIGGSGVTTSTGLKLNPGQGVSINLANTGEVYVVAAGTGATADVLYG